MERGRGARGPAHPMTASAPKSVVTVTYGHLRSAPLSDTSQLVSKRVVANPLRNRAAIGKELGSSRPHHFLGPHQAVKFRRRDIAQTDRLFAQRRPIGMRGLRDGRG